MIINSFSCLTRTFELSRCWTPIEKAAQCGRLVKVGSSRCYEHLWPLRLLTKSRLHTQLTIDVDDAKLIDLPPLTQPLSLGCTAQSTQAVQPVCAQITSCGDNCAMAEIRDRAIRTGEQLTLEDFKFRTGIKSMGAWRRIRNECERLDIQLVIYVRDRAFCFTDGWLEYCQQVGQATYRPSAPASSSN